MNMVDTKLIGVIQMNNLPILVTLQLHEIDHLITIIDMSHEILNRDDKTPHIRKKLSLIKDQFNE